MGTSMSAALKAQQAANDEAFMELMQMFHKQLVNKIAATSESMKTAAIEDKSLPILAVVDTTEKYLIKCANKSGDEVGNAIDEVLSGKFLNGLKSLVKTGLDELLGNESGGESETKSFHVVFANNSLLRVDYMMYKFQFVSEGLQKKAQNLFCNYLQVGVLDLEKVDPQILLYELTRSIGESSLPGAAKDLADITSFAKDLYAVVHQMGQDATQATPEYTSGTLAIGATRPALSEEEKQARKNAILARYKKEEYTPFVVERQSLPDGSARPEQNYAQE